MGYQTGTVGPIAYYQDNSGNANDTDTSVRGRVSSSAREFSGDLVVRF